MTVTRRLTRRHERWVCMGASRLGDASCEVWIDEWTARAYGVVSVKRDGVEYVMPVEYYHATAHKPERIEPISVGVTDGVEMVASFDTRAQTLEQALEQARAFLFAHVTH